MSIADVELTIATGPIDVATTNVELGIARAAVYVIIADIEACVHLLSSLRLTFAAAENCERSG